MRCGRRCSKNTQAGKLDSQEAALFKKLRKAVLTLAANRFMYPGLATHEIAALTKRYGVKVWQSYLENNKPAADRLFWVYGPPCGVITIIGLEAHPESGKSRGYESVRFPRRARRKRDGPAPRKFRLPAEACRDDQGNVNCPASMRRGGDPGACLATEGFDREAFQRLFDFAPIEAVATGVSSSCLLGNCFRAGRTVDGENADRRRGVRGSGRYPSARMASNVTVSSSKL